METQSTGTEDGFTPVTHRGGRRAKKRQAEQSSAAGQDGEAGRMDTEEARPAKRPVFPPLSGDQLLVGIRTGRDGAGRGPGVQVKGSVLGFVLFCCFGGFVCLFVFSPRPASLSRLLSVYVFIADWERRNEENSRPR
jgi:hypothetical protein